MRSNPIRDAILNLLEDRAEDMEGATATEVLDALQVSPRLEVVMYHLRVLADSGRLTCEDSKGAAPRYRLTS